jgi:HPt (histidine-containing phosphotransfer) domain-containing protein
VEPVFSRVALDTLASQAAPMGHEFVCEILDEALRSIDICIATIEKCTAARDLAGLRAAAHRVKSVLAQVGALRMAAAAKRVEELAQRGDESAFGIVPALVSATPETVAALRAYMAGPGA